jgi:hypothetical protein
LLDSTIFLVLAAEVGSVRMTRTRRSLDTARVS